MNIKIMLVFKFKQQYMSNFDCCFHANVFFVQLKNLYSYFHFDIMIMIINRNPEVPKYIDNKTPNHTEIDL